MLDLIPQPQTASLACCVFPGSRFYQARRLYLESLCNIRNRQLLRIKYKFCAKFWVSETFLESSKFNRTRIMHKKITLYSHRYLNLHELHRLQLCACIYVL